MTVPQFTAESDVAEVMAALDEAGCVVVSNLIESDQRSSIVAELEQHMQAARVVEDDDSTEFYPGRTRRVTALLARSDSVTNELVIHPLTLKVCDKFLLPRGENCQKIIFRSAGPKEFRSLLFSPLKTMPFCSPLRTTSETCLRRRL